MGGFKTLLIMKITDLTENHNVLIATKKEAKAIKKQLDKTSAETLEKGMQKIGLPILIKKQGNIFTWGGTASILTLGTKQIPASKLLKPSLKKRFEPLYHEMHDLKARLDKLWEAHHASISIKDKIDIVHFDEVEKLPEKWCVKHSPEALEWIRKNAEKNGSCICTNPYYMFPANSSGNNSAYNKPDGYTEISFETFKRLVLKEDEKPVELPKNGWYKNHGALYYVENNTIKYGFDSDGVWKDVDAILDGGEQPATDEEVKEALIKEAERRGFKEGVKFLNPDTGNKRTLIRFSFDADLNALVSSTPDKEWNYGSNPAECSNPFIYERGKWAEIISEPEIDFSKAGQLVKSEHEVVLTTGWCNEKMFNGVDIRTGEFRSDWLIDSFTLCTEPVVLNNE